MGHTLWWAGSYEVTPPAVNRWGGVDRSLSGHRLAVSQPVYWVRPHPDLMLFVVGVCGLGGRRSISGSA